MKQLKNRLVEARDESGLTWEVIERDYVLSWILIGLSENPTLNNSIIFKGGTALKKCYFGNYRMSEDLDFSSIDAPKGDALENAIIETCKTAAYKLNEYVPVEITSERYTEREPHPGGQEAFLIKTKLPWHRQPHVRIMIEITMDEHVITNPVRKPILHTYGEDINCSIMTYSLEEIISEKLRAILQQQKLLEQRGWVRSRARDYYDLWRILDEYKEQLSLTDFSSLLQKKCALKNVSFKTWKDFFPLNVITIVENSWDQWLKPLVKDLPSCHHVINALKGEIKNLLST